MKLPGGAHLVPCGALGQSTQSISSGQVLQKAWFEMHTPLYKPVRYEMTCTEIQMETVPSACVASGSELGWMALKFRSGGLVSALEG